MDALSGIKRATSLCSHLDGIIKINQKTKKNWFTRGESLLHFVKSGETNVVPLHKSRETKIRFECVFFLGVSHCSSRGGREKKDIVL